MTALDQTPDSPEERARIARLQAEIRMREEERRVERERGRRIATFAQRSTYVLVLVLFLGVSVYGLSVAYPLPAMITVPMIALAALSIYTVLVRLDKLADSLERIERRLPKQEGE